ncbi:MAG TPA: class A beta-lactamase-related serine hydrolase [Bacteroidia bacterium]|nr:class A beta-lactamase-related serine hydrolase [Bacteroidia bacterium]
MKFLTRRIPIYYFLLILLLFGSAFTWLYQRPAKVIERVSEKNNCGVEIMRQNHFELTKPVLLVDVSSEEQSFINLKNNLSTYLEQQKSRGTIQSASVMFRQQTDGKWFAINASETYSPGSIMKVVTMICYLKAAENNPSILDKKILLARHFGEIPEQTLTGKSLVPGSYYKVRDLIAQMIIHSDNDAAVLLNSQVDFDLYKRILKDLDLPVPEKGQMNYEFTCEQCTRILRVLFNSSILEPESSEFALQLLSQSAYKEGIASLIDPSFKIARKFGERFYAGSQQLHETGIFYFKDRPYILTVMTKGPDHLALPKVLADVSLMVFNYMKDGNLAMR